MKVSSVIKSYQTTFTQGIHLVFTPSPNIGVYQLTHYQCSVDHTGVGIAWNVNGTASTNNDITKLGIVTNGVGSSNSSLIIPGYPQYNNTVVRCIASGYINKNIYYNYSESTLRLQGKYYFHATIPFLLFILISSGKLSVITLICMEQGHCCIKCSWSPPFSLDGVPIYGYIINVTNEGDNTQYTTTTNTTSWIYCPSQFSNYTVSIAGNNSAGEGKITSQVVMLLGKFYEYYKY